MALYRLAVLNTHPIQYFAPLYRLLARQPDIDLTVYFCSRQGADAYYDDGFGTEVRWDVPLVDGYRHAFLPNLRRSDRVGGFFSLVNPGIVGELRRGRYDALCVFGHSHATYLLGMASAKLTGTALLLRSETHADLPRPPIKRALRGPALGVLYRAVDAFLAIGSRNAQFYRLMRAPEERIFLAPHAVDNAFFAAAPADRAPDSSLREEVGLPPDAVVILTVCKLTSGKRPLDLMRAYAEVARESAGVALVFVGTGEELERLRRFQSSAGVPGVHFLGFRSQAGLPLLYALSDVFVLASDNESWGMVVNEAMAAGLPIVAARQVGAAADLVLDGVNGRVFEAGDITALAQHLRELAGNAGLRRRMGAASRRIVEGWSLDRTVEGIRAALEFVVGARTREPGPAQRE